MRVCVCVCVVNLFFHVDQWILDANKHDDYVEKEKEKKSEGKEKQSKAKRSQRRLFLLDHYWSHFWTSDERY